MVVSQRSIFAPRLSVKITLPYVALSLVLALATIYIIANSQANTVMADFSRQINDARVRVADSVVHTEQVQIANVRTLARLDGLAEAVQQRNTNELVRLVGPFAISQSIERIVVVNLEGSALVAVHSSGTNVEVVAANPSLAQLPSVQAVLANRQDTLGDKYVELADDDGVAVLYTIAPIYDGNTEVGAVLSGTSAETLVARWRAATLADISIYSHIGKPMATSLGSDSLQSLPAEALQTPPTYRTITLGSREYGEIVDTLALRGSPQPQFLGVSLSTAGQTVLLDNAQLSLLPIFGLGLIATFLLGIMLAQRITRPITALVRAAQGVADGNLDTVLPVTSGDEIGALTTSFNTMIGGLRERERMHDVFGRFVSPPVARLILSRPLDLRGETKQLSILFTDLRDFTAFAETEDPAVVIQSLNDYFRIVVDAADRYGGIVNKFGGDSTLVLFGLTDEQGNSQSSAEAAVLAALAIRSGLYDLNERRAESGAPPLLAGIGVNTGDVVAGLIGTEQRMEYTAIGDAVNMSSRIQTLSRKLETDILISQATYDALGQPQNLSVEDRGLRRLKGKTQRVRVYEVAGWEASVGA